MPVIKLLRKSSFGIDGTYKNAHHHAQKLLPLIDALVKVIPESKYQTWIQAHNVHILETVDGRKFILRPYSDETRYVGMTVSTKGSRLKSSEVFLFSVRYDENYEFFIKAVLDLANVNPSNGKNHSDDENV